VLDLVEAGRKVAEVAEDLGISGQTVYTWRRQDRIDRGLKPGLTSVEKAELVAARKRIRELEAELAVHRQVAEELGGTAEATRRVVERDLAAVRAPAASRSIAA
jgi:transposase-like protein